MKHLQELGLASTNKWVDSNSSDWTLNLSIFAMSERFPSCTLTKKVGFLQISRYCSLKLLMWISIGVRTETSKSKSATISDLLHSTDFLTYRPRLKLPKQALHDNWLKNEPISVLVQLATWTGHVYLIQLCYLRKIPQELLNFLADKSIVKLGTYFLIYYPFLPST